MADFLKRNPSKHHEICKENGIELINVGMHFFYPNISIEGRYEEAVKEFYQYMINDPRVFGNITEQLRLRFNDTNDLIEEGKKKFNISKNMKIDSTSLQKLLIYLYTTSSSKPIYKELNRILRESETTTKEAICLAPYAAALTATILHWNHLETTNETTYRGINRTITHNGSVFWTSFTSSSIDRDQAQKFGNLTTYIITNTGKAARQPKLIHAFSAKPDENEALYPPASFFKIKLTNSTVTGTTFYITLTDTDLNADHVNNIHDEFR